MEQLVSDQTDFCEILEAGVFLQSVYQSFVWLKLYKSNRQFALERTYIYDI